MRFLDQHEDYQNFRSETYFTDQMPKDFYKSFQSLIVAAARNLEENPAAVLREACDLIAIGLRIKPTQEWGYYPLISDLDYYLGKLLHADFHKQMDIIGDLASTLDLDADSINEELQNINFGFTYVPDQASGAMWNLIDEHIENNAENISAAEKVVDDKQINVFEHLKQAKKQLADVEDSRSRKEALRNVISALEAQLEYYTGETKVENAITHLKKHHKNLPKKILNDAENIWKYLHAKYPNLRHGSSNEIDITIEETHYWIDSSLAVLVYLARSLK